MEKQKLEYLQSKALDVRKIAVEMIGRLGVGHIGGSLSVVDLLAVLYYDIAKVDPKNPKDPDRDRIVMSKGHAGPAVYSVLADKGYFPMEEIKTLNQSGTNLPSHCDMNKTVGIDMTAGSLGQGLSCAIGMALAGKIDKKDYKVFCILGDGESQEGQVWEALMYAGNMRLNNLVIFIDNNGMQIDGMTADINGIEPLDEKGNAFNLHTQRINGHDIEAIENAINTALSVKDKTSLIILDTIKGYGVDFVASKGAGCHSMSITEEQWREFCGKEDE
ncbi:MAG: transketolase [Clostridia bacterium]|nr:transketolase [Clostridia bacterium]